MMRFNKKTFEETLTETTPADHPISKIAVKMPYSSVTHVMITIDTASPFKETIARYLRELVPTAIVDDEQPNSLLMILNHHFTAVHVISQLEEQKQLSSELAQTIIQYIQQQARGKWCLDQIIAEAQKKRAIHAPLERMPRLSALTQVSITNALQTPKKETDEVLEEDVETQPDQAYKHFAP